MEEQRRQKAEGRLEEVAYAQGFRCVAGLDEVGRGPWAGPVVAAAVVLPREFLVPGFELRAGSKLGARGSRLEIKDSKLLSPKKREELAVRIKEKALVWGLGIVDVEEIDRINILKASLLAMSLALKRLIPRPDYLLIDGSHKIPVEFLRRVQEVQGVQDVPFGSEPQGRRQNGLNDLNGLKRFEPLPVQKAVEKGDRLSISIAAASIVAKVARDQMMVQYDSLYPEYGFVRHKGYGSPGHLAALRTYGPSPIHRRSYRPVRECQTIGLTNGD